MMQYDSFCTLKILKSLAANYPVLRYLGYAISKPIVIIAEEKDFSTLLNYTENISLVGLEVCVEKNCQESANADFCWTIYRPRGSGKKLEKAIEYALKAYEAPENTAPPVMILSESRILWDVDMDFIRVFVEKLPAEEIALQDVVPEDCELPLVFEKIAETIPECGTQTERAFVAAACFLFPMYRRKNLVEMFPRLIEQAKFLAERSEAGIEGVVDLFLDEAYRWQKQSKDLAAFSLPELGMGAIKSIPKAIFIDQLCFYLSNELFHEIAKPLLRIFSEEQIKAALVKKGILLPESDQTFMTKMNFRSVAGTYERRRMLRFSREEFNKIGEIEFVSACQIRMEEMQYEN